MILKKIVILLIAVLFFTQLFAWLPSKKPPYQKYGVYLDEIQETFNRKMFDEFSLISRGGGGQMHEKVETIEIEFEAPRHATIEEARVLQLLVMNRFVQEINAHEKIRPFLEVSPITYKQISIEISYNGGNGPYYDGDVYYIYNVDDKAEAIENRNHLYYYANDPFTDQTFVLLRESYEEAIKRAAPHVNHYAHQTSELEFNTDQMLSSFVKQMREKYHLQALAIGGKINPTIEEIGARFTVIKKASQEQARAFLLAVVDQLIQTLNTNDPLQKDLAEYPFPTNRLKIGINFTKKNHLSYSHGSIESVTLENDEITYYENPPADAESWPIDTPIFAKESYQEAVKLAKD